MACPCCLPKCCPAYRAFDGSNTFYRYLTYYDWDIPTAGTNPYTLTQADDAEDFAIFPETGQRAPAGRNVDGHRVLDATVNCAGYPTDTIPAGGVFRAPGQYGHAQFPWRLPVQIYGALASINAPWRQKNIFNVGMSGQGGFWDAFDSYSPAYGDPRYNEFAGGQNPISQKPGKSLLRLELTGEYPAPPSPYCYLNQNPLP